MDETNIRPANLKDLDILLKYEQGVISAERPFDVTLADDPISYYDIRAMIESEDAQVAVVEKDGEVVSSGYAIKKSAKPYLIHKEYSYLGFMYTHPDYRGQGLNKKILEFLKEWSYAKGLKEIRLTVYEDNLPAIKAYEKAGFEKHIIEMRLK
ncbi:ribosomal protein S18 acetylase RimI-like enzyme [Saonia flava]|uniref:Ribosomal protein S18 acetylase RimI-like enzyme n=1 Tax=Saonia flava TaxID=523696 RepID=A0A846QUW8_9FLAO|nr:GNAT family N-acetyltransferase [Saonia flava]NJB70740.1 ribosomal protein S18 acetylase RimI-like enzyme [Saonia flava]